MRVAIFFLWLCLFLVKGGECSQAVGPSHGCGYDRVQYIQPVQLKKSSAINDEGTVINTISLYHPNGTFIIAGDVEDEDANNSLVRKFKWLEKCYSAQLYQSSANYSTGSSKSAASFYGRISHKYILQRVLRV